VRGFFARLSRVLLALFPQHPSHWLRARAPQATRTFRRATMAPPKSRFGPPTSRAGRGTGSLPLPGVPSRLWLLALMSSMLLTLSPGAIGFSTTRQDVELLKVPSSCAALNMTTSGNITLPESDATLRKLSVSVDGGMPCVQPSPHATPDETETTPPLFSGNLFRRDPSDSPFRYPT